MRAGETLREKLALSTPLASAQLTETASQWILEDFLEIPPGDYDSDPWEPLYVFRAPDSPTSEDRSNGVPPWEDFWDPISPISTDIKVGTLDWQTNIALPDFVPHAAQNPFHFDTKSPSSEDKASQRARWLVFAAIA